MSRTAEDLYQLLPAVYRIRDSELARNGDGHGPLYELLAVLAEQVGVLEENVLQLYDDQFIETCAEWVVPYIGDLIGYRPLHGVVPRVARPRAEVAHTLAYRRRKGTASMLEQLAQDVTDWPAHVVEFFQLLSTTQYLNHLRPLHSYAPDLRQWEPLERLDTAFDRLSHTVDVRRIRSRRGHHNIHNVGIFLWRLNAFSLTDSPAVRAGARRYRFSPLGHDMPLFTRRRKEPEISHLAEPINVPMRLSRRVLDQRLSDYYGGLDDHSLELSVAGSPVPLASIVVCNLDGPDTGWGHLPPDDKYAIDPVLGRIGLPANAPAGPVLVRFHYGFGAELGGGEYDRGKGSPTVRVPDDFPTIQDALNALAGAGTVEIADSGRYPEEIRIAVAADRRIVLRSANQCRATLVLPNRLVIEGGPGSEVILDGLLVAGRGLEVPNSANNALDSLIVRHCTLVPGYSLDPHGLPEQPDRPSLLIRRAGVNLRIDRSVTGALRVVSESSACLTDCIVDGLDSARLAYGDPNEAAGGILVMDGCTVIGGIRAQVIHMSNAICTSQVVAQRRQEGCVRFSYLTLDSQVSRRHRCVPTETGSPVGVTPHFSSLRYGTPSYAQLRPSTPSAIRRGADDEGEMGAFHLLYQPQREANLRTRLDEYLRVGLEAGILYET